jgi:hypothetical protein
VTVTEVTPVGTIQLSGAPVYANVHVVVPPLATQLPAACTTPA